MSNGLPLPNLCARKPNPPCHMIPLLPPCACPPLHCHGSLLSTPLCLCFYFLNLVRRRFLLLPSFSPFGSLALLLLAACLLKDSTRRLPRVAPPFPSPFYLKTVKVPRGYGPPPPDRPRLLIFPVMDDFCTIYTAPRRYVIFCFLVCYILASHSLPAVVCTTPFASQLRTSLKKGVAVPGLPLDTALSFVFMTLYFRLLQPSVNRHEVFTFIPDSRTD